MLRPELAIALDGLRRVPQALERPAGAVERFGHGFLVCVEQRDLEVFGERVLDAALALEQGPDAEAGRGGELALVERQRAFERGSRWARLLLREESAAAPQLGF